MAYKIGCIIIALLVGFMTACGPRAVMGSEEYAEVDFSAFQSYAYLPSHEPDSSLYHSVYQERVIREINLQMESRGYVLDQAAPELLVLVNTMFEEEQHASRRFLGRSYDYYMPGFFENRPMGPIFYEGYHTIPKISGPAGIREIAYTEGTFIIDIIDASSHEILWRGWAQTPVDTDDIDRSIKTYINSIFAEYPLDATAKRKQ